MDGARPLIIPMIFSAGPPSPLDFLPWFLAASPFWWCLTLLFISHACGWRALAQRHPAGAAPPAGVTYRFRNGRLQPFGGQYRNCLNVTLAREGLYVVPMFLFRPFHRPLLLPWSSVDGTAERRFIGLRSLEVRIRSGERTLTLYLPDGAAAFLAPLRLPPPLPVV